MTDLTVCAVMLTRDRPEMARRAAECFRAQSYQEKRLLIYNMNTAVEYGHIPSVPGSLQDDRLVVEIPHGPDPRTIGMLRNTVNQRAGQAQILIHWDDDDWSHPNRIAEQVAMLQSSDADCVGYREMLFWREPQLVSTPDDYDELGAGFADGEAWIYADAYRPVGTSLCYWRRTWEQHPFPDLPNPRRQPNPDVRGEDVEWLRGVNFKAVGSMVCDKSHMHTPQGGCWEPRMIARIHSGNSSGSYAELGKSVWWRRVPEWDTYCQARMTL